MNLFEVILIVLVILKLAALASLNVILIGALVFAAVVTRIISAGFRRHEEERRLQLYQRKLLESLRGGAPPPRSAD